MKPSLITFLCLLLCTFATYGHSLPDLTLSEAERIIDLALQRKDLKWQPFHLPYEVSGSIQSKETRWLSALMDYKLLIRRPELKPRMVEEYGRKRRRITAIWLYDYADRDERQHTDDGFSYGIGRLKRIQKLSPAYFIDNAYYVEAYIEWFVDELQDWTNNAAFDDVRVLRRSRESRQKPFEQRVYLQHDGSRWAFWEGQPGSL